MADRPTSQRQRQSALREALRATGQRVAAEQTNQAPAVQTVVHPSYYALTTGVLQLEAALATAKAQGMSQELVDATEATLRDMRAALAAMPVPTTNPFGG